MSDEEIKKTVPPKRPNGPPSENFFREFSHGGSITISCQCGVTYFSSSGDYDKGELERYRGYEKKEPSKYIETGDDYISYIELSGKTYAEGCPCNFARPYEDFIWSFRREIAGYLRRRVMAEFEEKDWERQAIMGTLTDKQPAQFRSRATARSASRSIDRRVPRDVIAHIEARAVADAHRQVIREVAAGNMEMIASNERVLAAMKGRGDDPIDS